MITFDEGRKLLAQSGLPGTGYFLLSTKDEASFVHGDTLAGGVAEITGTGYARQSQALPVPTSANPTVVTFSVMTFATNAATDWPAAVKSVVLVSTANNTGKAIAAWNLNGTTGRAMNAANTTEQVTPVLNLQ